MEKAQSSQIFKIVCFLVIISEISIDVYLPAFSDIAKYYATHINNVQFSLSVFFLGFALSPLIVGPLSDYYGRKKILIILLSVFTLANFMILFSSSIGEFILLRFVSGLSACFASVLATAIMRDIYTGNDLAQSFSVISMLWSVIPSVAPVIGGYIIHFLAWKVIFALTAMIALVLLILSITRLPETMKLEHKPANIDFSVYVGLLKNRQFIISVILTGIIYSIFSAYITFAPAFLFLKFHLSGVVIGWLQLVFAISYFAGNYLNAYLLKKMSINKIINFGQYWLLIATIFYFIIALLCPNSLNMFILSIVLLTAPLALIFANYCALAMTSCAENIIASAGALLGSVQMGCCFAASSIIALFPDGNSFYYGILVLFAVLMFFRVKRLSNEIAN